MQYDMQPCDMPSSVAFRRRIKQLLRLVHFNVLAQTETYRGPQLIG